MKTTLQWFLAITFMVLSWCSYAQDEADEESIYATLENQLKRACPHRWEGLDASMDIESLDNDPWQGNDTDKNEFIGMLQDMIEPIPSEDGENDQAPDFEAMATDPATIATECASHRVALLDALISKTPKEVLLAMDTVNKGLNKSVEYLDGGWSVGDVRVTGRLEAQDGWVFLTGQTIGNASSGAVLAGEDYIELFDLAKNWHPNTGNENWEVGNKVTLPDMRGRALVAKDNMGGVSANRATHPDADKIGGAFGTESRALTASQLPTHKHTVNTAGNHGHTTNNAGYHNHSMGYGGYHKHSSKQALYGAGNYGWGTFSNKWPTGGIRPNTDGGNSATLTNAIFSAGNHKHSIGTAPHHKHTVNAAGNHAHTTSNAGSSASVNLNQNSMVFNVEMKY